MFNSKPLKTTSEQVDMDKFQTQILNFMKKKELHWNVNKSFSYQMSLNVKESIIDAFIRIRLKEGFRCLFQNAKMAVFCIQLTMFDSGEFLLQNQQQPQSKQPYNEETESTKKMTNLDKTQENTSPENEVINNLFCLNLIQEV